jgi:hypothetical protein
MALGVLVAGSVHLKSPVGVIIGYALFAALTALRFRALEWKVAGAFVPLAIVVAATLLSPVLEPSAVAAAHGVALIAQIFISGRAGLSTGPHDRVSLKQALARDQLSKRVTLARTIRESKPLREAHRRETAKLLALNEERKAYIAAHGLKMTDEYQALLAQFEAQKAVIEPLGAQTRAVTEHILAQTEEVREAAQAWKNRNQRTGE